MFSYSACRKPSLLFTELAQTKNFWSLKSLALACLPISSCFNLYYINQLGVFMWRILWLKTLHFTTDCQWKFFLLNLSLTQSYPLTHYLPLSLPHCILTTLSLSLPLSLKHIHGLSSSIQPYFGVFSFLRNSFVANLAHWWTLLLLHQRLNDCIRHRLTRTPQIFSVRNFCLIFNS